MTEREKDDIAEAILKMYKGFAEAGYYTTSEASQSEKRHLGTSTTKEEGDEICAMVVQLLQNIKRKMNEDA